jgi:hypothetical protein
MRVARAGRDEGALLHAFEYQQDVVGNELSLNADGREGSLP